MRTSNVHNATKSSRLLLSTMILLTGIESSATCADPTAYAPPIKVSELQNRKVSESSGLAASRIRDDLFWTHNDSGDRARLYCFDVQGNHLGTTELKNAEAIDWEDVCSFDRDGKPRLLVGDIGDNGGKRKSCQLYLLEEPTVQDASVQPLQEIKLKYATGPMDCEALAVDPVSGKILFVEKRRWLTCRVFMAPLPEENEDKVTITAEPIAQIRVPLVTSMDISCDGRRAVVLTLGQAFEFRRDAQEDWATAFAKKPKIIDMPPRKQGEAVCYDRQGQDLYLTSEFAPCPLFLVKAIYDKTATD